MPIWILNAIGFAKGLGWKDWLLVMALGIILVLMTTCAVDGITDHFAQNAEVRENNADRKLRDDLAEKRLNDVTDIRKSERKLNETLSKLPSGIPSDRRIARACDELRNNGLSELPIACRS